MNILDTLAKPENSIYVGMGIIVFALLVMLIFFGRDWSKSETFRRTVWGLVSAAGWMKSITGIGLCIWVVFSLDMFKNETLSAVLLVISSVLISILGMLEVIASLIALRK